MKRSEREAIAQALLKAAKALEASTLTAASEVALDDLDPKYRDAAISLGKALGLKVAVCFEGIHGVIVSYDVSTRGMSERLNKKDLTAILNTPGFRWIECDDHLVSVGL